MRAVIRLFPRLRSQICGDEGASVVETAVASTVFLAMLIGVFQMMLALYTFHFISDAAREATRYAMVRGSTSCTNTPNLSNCNATTDQITAYVQGLSYPGIIPGKLTVTTTWLTASNTAGDMNRGTATYPTTWSACASGTCNAPGNQVNVVVTYAFPLNVPFVPKATIPLSSTSEMVISQ